MLDTTYLIIPEIVAQDIRINNFDKLLFGKIYSLTKQQGYCWATNDYFANYYHESLSYISKSMRRLESCGYITRIIDNKQENSKRRIVYVNQDYINKLTLENKTKRNDSSLVL